MFYTYTGTSAWPVTCDEDEEIIPPAILVIKEEYEPLFFSASWTIRAYVNDIVIAESLPSDNARSEGAIRQWARAFIRGTQGKLTARGVDVVKEYTEKWGGLGRDL